MNESVESKTLLASFDRLVLALRADPVTIWNELAAAGLIPSPDGQIEAQRLSQRILDIVKVEPARYDDVVKVLSKHDWLKDIVNILETVYNHTEEETQCNTKEASRPNKCKSGHKESDATDSSDHEELSATPSTPSKEVTECDKLEYDYPHKPSSLPVPNPVVLFEELSEDDRDDLFSQMSEMTKDMNLRFKKLFNQVYESFRKRLEHNSVILTLTKDDVMIFEQDDEVEKAKSMFEVFKAIRPHCSYFNYDLLELLVEVHGSAEDQEKLKEYLQSFSGYCKAMPCAEEVCGNGDSGPQRIKLKFKINLDRQQLKPDALRRIKCNIARHIKIKPRSLYLCRVDEGCVLLEFLIPKFLFDRIFPLNDEQRVTLYKEEEVVAIQCDSPPLHVDIKEDALLLTEAIAGSESMIKLTGPGMSTSSVASSGYFSGSGSTYQLMEPSNEFQHFPSEYQRLPDRRQTAPISLLQPHQVDKRGLVTAPHYLDHSGWWELETPQVDAAQSQKLTESIQARLKEQLEQLDDDESSLAKLYCDAINRLAVLEEKRKEMQDMLFNKDEQLKIYHKRLERERYTREIAIKVKNLVEKRMKKMERDMKELRYRLNQQGASRLREDLDFGLHYNDQQGYHRPEEHQVSGPHPSDPSRFGGPHLRPSFVVGQSHSQSFEAPPLPPKGIPASAVATRRLRKDEYPTYINVRQPTAPSAYTTYGELLNEAPPSMTCPLCEKSDFKTQTDLELHCATCDS